MNKVSAIILLMVFTFSFSVLADRSASKKTEQEIMKMIKECQAKIGNEGEPSDAFRDNLIQDAVEKCKIDEGKPEVKTRRWNAFRCRRAVTKIMSNIDLEECKSKKASDKERSLNIVTENKRQGSETKARAMTQVGEYIAKIKECGIKIIDEEESSESLELSESSESSDTIRDNLLIDAIEKCGIEFGDGSLSKSPTLSETRECRRAITKVKGNIDLEKCTYKQGGQKGKKAF